MESFDFLGPDAIHTANDTANDTTNDAITSETRHAFVLDQSSPRTQKAEEHELTATTNDGNKQEQQPEDETRPEQKRKYRKH